MPNKQKQERPGEEGEALSNEALLTGAEVQGTVAIEAWASHLPVKELNILVREVHDTVRKVSDGNMKPVEYMLLSQALALQNLFTNLARRAAKQDHLKVQSTYLTFALKAQAQCRATLEALAEIKNPRSVAFVRQANVAHGPQQVNNAPQASRAENNANRQNGLLEATDESRLVSRATGTTSRSHQEVEAVGTVDGTAHT